MKGYFSLKKDTYLDKTVSFGNLGENGEIACLHDLYLPSSRLCSMLAHDVIEHDVGHRTRTYVTMENEIRALGAVEFVRGYESFSSLPQEVCDLFINYYLRDIKPVPFIVQKHLEDLYPVNEYAHLSDDDIWLNNHKNAMAHFFWGQHQKDTYYKGNDALANHDFHFISNIAPDIFKKLYDNEKASGISVYFDSLKQIYRTQFKHQ